MECSNGDSFGQFLDSCPKLSCLHMIRVNFKSSPATDSVFQRTYPMLKDFQYTDCDTAPQLITFLEQNPSIKCLRIRARDLWQIPCDTALIQLDFIHIKIDWLDIYDENVTIELTDRLKQLHANGVYGTLSLSTAVGVVHTEFEMFVSEMASFDALKVLHMEKFRANICHLTGLKELHLYGIKHQADAETVARNLINLERLRFGPGGTIEHLMPFLRHSMKLKYAILDNSLTFGMAALNSMTLNELRRMDGAKRKVRIGVPENLYLTSKWKTQNVNCDLVEVTRVEMIREHFDYMNASGNE